MIWYTFSTLGAVPRKNLNADNSNHYMHECKNKKLGKSREPDEIVNTDFRSCFLSLFFLRSLLLTNFGETPEDEIWFH